MFANLTLTPTLALVLGLAVFTAGAGTGVAVERIVAAPQVRSAVDVQASEQALERGNLPPAEQVTLMRSVAEFQLESRDYPAAIAWSKRYVKAGGAETEIRPILIEAYYRIGDFANAARELQWEVQGAEKGGRVPGEDRLLMLQNCYTKLNDANAIAWSLEKLVTWYPKRDYWAELLDRTEKRADFGEAVSLDVGRLRLATGSLRDAAEYLKLAAQAREAGFPGEAKSVIESGLARGVFGTDAQRQRKLLQQYAGEAGAQQRRLAEPQAEEAAEKAKDGIELVNLGFAHVTLGNPPKGIALMEQGIRKGGGLAGKPQFARLRLGIAYLLAGDKARAIDIFKSIGGKHGGADLGRLWAIHTQNLG
jgi:hypothetical protein